MSSQYRSSQEEKRTNPHMRRFSFGNKACPKDDFPLPVTEIIIDHTHPMKCSPRGERKKHFKLYGTQGTLPHACLTAFHICCWLVTKA